MPRSQAKKKLINFMKFSISMENLQGNECWRKMPLAPKRVEMCSEKSMYTRALYMQPWELCEYFSVLQCVHPAVDALCGGNSKENKSLCHTNERVMAHIAESWHMHGLLEVYMIWGGYD